MLQIKKIFFFIFLVPIVAFSQEKITLSGTVYDNSNNETLIGVSIFFSEINAGTSTNEYGFYSITIPKGTYKIKISSLGFNTISETIVLLAKTTKDFKLMEVSENLDEIII